MPQGLESRPFPDTDAVFVRPDPEAPLPVFEERADAQGAEAVGGADGGEAPPFVHVQARAVRANPEPPLAVLQQRVNVVDLELPLIEGRETDAVEPHQAIGGAQPQVAVAGPDDRLNLVPGQPVLDLPDIGQILAARRLVARRRARDGSGAGPDEQDRQERDGESKRGGYDHLPKCRQHSAVADGCHAAAPIPSAAHAFGMVPADEHGGAGAATDARAPAGGP